MRANNDSGALVECIGERGQCGPNTCVVVDDTVTDRDVEVGTDEEAPPSEVELVNSFLRHFEAFWKNGATRMLRLFLRVPSILTHRKGVRCNDWFDGRLPHSDWLESLFG